MANSLTPELSSDEGSSTRRNTPEIISLNRLASAAMGWYRRRVAPHVRDSLVGILVCAVILFAIEAVARVASTVVWDLRSPTFIDGAKLILDFSPKLGWVIKHPFDGQLPISGHRSYNAQGILTVDARQLGHTGKPRILFIGASNMFGYGVKTSQSFPEVVEDLLPEADTVNLGVLGYSSYQSRLVAAAQVPALHPAVIVVACGFNDRREGPNGAVDGPQTFQALYQSAHSPAAKIARFLEPSYTYRDLERLLRAIGLIPPDDSKSINLARAKPRVSEKSFHDNLVAIAELAKAEGTSVVFLLFGDNPQDIIHITEGVRRLEAGDYRSAVAILKVAADYDLYKGLAHVYLAKAYRALGETDKADEALRRKTWHRFDGALPIRLAQTYNAITREVAARYGATVVDLEDVINRRPYLTASSSHLSPEGHRVVAEELVKVLRPMIAKGSQNARK